jgi:hypothetical protein
VEAGFSPLDEELGLPAGSWSPFLVEAVVRLATWMPFGRAVAEVAWFTGTPVSATTVRRLTEGAGATYVAGQTAEAAALEREAPPAPPGPAVQALSVDGAMVPLVGGAWAEVKTLALGTVTARPPGRRRRPQQEVATSDLSYFSRMTDHETFTRLALVETHRRGTETAGTVCAVCDGAAWIPGFVDHHRPDAVRILDWPHAVGYLAVAAAAVYGAETAAAKAWLGQGKATLLHGDPAVLLADLAHLHATVAAVAAGRQERWAWAVAPPRPTDPPLRGVLGREGAQQAAPVVAQSREYLRAREAQIQYAAFRAAQYPLGSGSVESANKLLVESRLKGAGMRWAPAHVNPMVALRTVAAGDRWAEAWPLILRAQRRDRQVRATQRRQTRQAARTRRAAAQAAAAETVTTPVPGTPAPPIRKRTPAPARTRPSTPAADHPWRHATLRNRRSA